MRGREGERMCERKEGKQEGVCVRGRMCERKDSEREGGKERERK